MGKYEMYKSFGFFIDLELKFNEFSSQQALQNDKIIEKVENFNK